MGYSAVDPPKCRVEAGRGQGVALATCPKAERSESIPERFYAAGVFSLSVSPPAILNQRLLLGYATSRITLRDRL